MKPQGNNHTKTVPQAIVQFELGLYIFEPKKLNSTAQYAACDLHENSISREKTNTAWNGAKTNIVWNVKQLSRD